MQNIRKRNVLGGARQCTQHIHKLIEQRAPTTNAYVQNV